MGRPQNFVSFVALDSLVLDVLGGRRIGDRRDDLVEPDRNRRSGIRVGLDGDLLRRAVQVARCLVPLLSLAAVHGQLDDGPHLAVKRLVLVQQGLNPVLAGGNLAQALDRITQRGSIDDGLLSGLRVRRRRCRRSAVSSGFQ